MAISYNINTVIFTIFDKRIFLQAVLVTAQMLFLVLLLYIPPHREVHQWPLCAPLGNRGYVLWARAPQWERTRRGGVRNDIYRLEVRKRHQANNQPAPSSSASEKGFWCSICSTGQKCAKMLKKKKREREKLLSWIGTCVSFYLSIWMFKSGLLWLFNVIAFSPFTKCVFGPLWNLLLFSEGL